jgi:hypothetical protein
LVGEMANGIECDRPFRPLQDRKSPPLYYCGARLSGSSFCSSMWRE